MPDVKVAGRTRCKSCDLSSIEDFFHDTTSIWQGQLFQKADNYHYNDWRIADFTR